MVIKCVEVGMVIILAVVTIIAGMRGNLTRQLPVCKIIVYVGIGVAVIVSAIFEIATNFCELLGKKKKRVIIAEKKYIVTVKEIKEE